MLKFKTIENTALTATGSGVFAPYTFRLGDMDYTKSISSRFRWFRVSRVKVEVFPLQKTSFALDIPLGQNQYTGPAVPFTIGTFRAPYETAPNQETRDIWNRKVLRTDSTKKIKFLFKPNTVLNRIESGSGVYVNDKDYGKWYPTRNDVSVSNVGSLSYFGYWINIDQWDTWFGTGEWEGGVLNFMIKTTIYWQARDLDISNIPIS